MATPPKPAGKEKGKPPAALPLPENFARIATNALSIANAADSLLRSGGAKVGLADWVLLRRLAAQPEAQPMGRIARQMGVTRQRIQKQVDRLAAEGLVSVTMGEDDKRKRSMTVTRAGTERLAAVAKVWTQKLGGSEEISGAKNLDGLRQRVTQVSNWLGQLNAGEKAAGMQARKPGKS